MHHTTNGGIGFGRNSGSQPIAFILLNLFPIPIQGPVLFPGTTCGFHGTSFACIVHIGTYSILLSYFT